MLYGTGFGPSDPPIPAGQAVVNAAGLAQPVTVTIGGLQAEVKSFYVFPGLYQFNVTVPTVLPDGDAKLSLSIVGNTTQDDLLLSIAK
jgi:uncharacterized protein (TIGR03437 family)